MQPHSFLWHYLWLAPLAVQMLVGAVVVRRKLYRDFPAFLAYTIYEIVLRAVLFVLDHDPAVSSYQYRWFEWAGEVGSIALRFAIVQEIFSVVFRSYPALKELGTAFFRWATAGLVLVAVAAVAYGPGPAVDYAPRITAGLTVLDRAVAIVQCGLLLFLYLFASYLGLSWRSYVFGIASGLGIYSAVQLATAAIQAQTGPGPNAYLLDLVVMGAYHWSVLIWLFYLLAPEPARRPVRALPTHDLESWNDELQRLLQR